ncbi:hypothetical protein [Actinomadura oligospora]|uniref:hypothetical protein n=1 Tax=Actinomadura oligospora TaxID=111804 RepID=UPI00047874CB|nr:hypothetical protein [Actinomadura oligospora]
MRKILTIATAAALAVGLSACNVKVTGDDKADGAPSSTAPLGGPSGAPKGTVAPGSGHHTTAPSHQGGGGVNAATGKLSYLAPGKFLVGNTAFFTATDTVLIVAGGKCPDDAARPDNRCTTDNMDMWVKSAPRFAKVSFSGQIATVIREVAG